MKITLGIMLLFGMISFFTTALSAINVSGTVVGSDAPTTGLPDAAIVLEGDINYTAVTNAQGQFTIADVTGNSTYIYTVTHAGYYPATGNINVGAVNFNMGTIMLNELAYPPTNVLAAINEPNVDINWTHSISPLSGYKVWRLLPGQELTEWDWIYLTPVIVIQPNYTDTGWASLPSGIYMWAVKAIIVGNVYSPPAFSNPLEKVVSNPDSENPPITNISVSCIPNPFRTETSLDYSLKVTSPVRLEIYNLKGQKVRTLVDETKSAGNYQVEWNCTDDNQKLSAGIYFYKLTAGIYTSTGKMILIK